VHIAPGCGEEDYNLSKVESLKALVPIFTLGYLDEDNSYWRKWFPAEFVTEIREQIRLWFYSLLFMSVTLTEEAPYRSALVYEKVHDERGRPMHKSWGNVIRFA